MTGDSGILRAVRLTGRRSGPSRAVRSFASLREWYASAEARAAADSVIQYQSPVGRMDSRTPNLLKPPSKPGELGRPTIDNNATIEADAVFGPGGRGHGRSQDIGKPSSAVWNTSLPLSTRTGAGRSISPCGRVTTPGSPYNDNAMVNVLMLLRDVSSRRCALRFCRPGTLREKASASLARGIRSDPAAPRSEAAWPAHRLVRSARREYAGACLGACLRAAVALRRRNRRYRALPDVERGSLAGDRCGN